MTALTPRQRREKEYYDRYAVSYARADVSFEPIEGKERRPWNSYWQQFHIVQDHFTPGARLLDFGCGWGAVSVVFAKIGYEVHGFDISESNIAAARRVAEDYGLDERMSLSVQTAERLEFPDAYFDVVAGVDILHHVDVAPAMRECRRVLRPGGIAVFREPLLSPVFDAVRNWPVTRRFFPNDPSFDRHITEDERKLEPADIEAIRSVFQDTEITYFRVLSRLEKIVPSMSKPLERIDRGLSWVPGMNRVSGYGILVMRKPLEG